MSWIAATPDSEQIINLFMNYECWDLCIQLQPVFWSSSRLCLVLLRIRISFSTPSEVFTLIKPVDSISVPYPISWVDEERLWFLVRKCVDRKRSVRLMRSVNVFVWPISSYPSGHRVLSANSDHLLYEYKARHGTRWL